MPSRQKPYTAYRVRKAPALNGRLDDPVWQAAPKSPRFGDMATGRPAILNTQCAALWDDQNLYVGFWVEEPYPTAKQTERDSLIFQENDVEVFIDGGDCYYELEINALGTVYEVFFIWRDAYGKGSRFDSREFDLLTHEGLSFGGDFDRTPGHFWTGTHPRGTRWAFRNWDFPGMKCAVNVDGKVNDLSKPSKGWTVEIAFPWKGMKHLADGRPYPPQEGDVWRMFFGRFQQLHVGGENVQAAWSCTPHGVYDTHMPEKFTQVQFSTAFVDEK